MTVAQLSIFDVLDDAPTCAALSDLQVARLALDCLHQADPNALEVLVGIHLDRPSRRQSSGHACSGGGFAYSMTTAGYHVDRAGDHFAAGVGRGWETRPRYTVSWPELAALLAADPRRAAVVDWSQCLTAPDAWRDRMRPHEMWPDSSGWHPSYIEGDRNRPGWDARRRAWETTLAIFADARAAL